MSLESGFAKAYLELLWPDWQNYAVCRGDDPFWQPYFGEDSGKRVVHSEEDIEIAKGLCGVCPVRSECLEYAYEYNIKYGIWGGLTAPERLGTKNEESEESE